MRNDDTIDEAPMLQLPPEREVCGCDGAITDSCYNCEPERWACRTCGFPLAKLEGVRTCLHCQGFEAPRDVWEKLGLCPSLKKAP